MLKNATLEIIKKDLKKQQQKQQLSQKQIISDRQRKGSRDNIKNRNRFDCLSDSSDMSSKTQHHEVVIIDRGHRLYLHNF